MSAHMGTEATPLRRHYERLLRIYPGPYWAAHGAELIGTLMEAAPAGQRVPSRREAFGLVVGGLRARARQAAAGSPPWWLDGLHLGVFLVTLLMLTGSTAWNWTLPGLALSLLVVLATMRGWAWAALPLAVLAALHAWGVLLPGPAPRGAGSESLAPHLVAIAGLAALTVFTIRRRDERRLRHRSWWWLLLPLAAGVLARFGPAEELGMVWVPAFTAVETLALLAAVTATVLARDARWVVAVVIYELPGLLSLGGSAWQVRMFEFAFLMILGIVVLAVLVAVSARRRRRIDA